MIYTPFVLVVTVKIRITARITASFFHIVINDDFNIFSGFLADFPRPQMLQRKKRRGLIMQWDLVSRWTDSPAQYSEIIIPNNIKDGGSK